MGSFYFSLLLSLRGGKNFLSSTFHECPEPCSGDESRTLLKVRDEDAFKGILSVGNTPVGGAGFIILKGGELWAKIFFKKGLLSL